MQHAHSALPTNNDPTDCEHVHHGARQISTTAFIAALYLCYVKACKQTEYLCNRQCCEAELNLKLVGLLYVTSEEWVALLVTRCLHAAKSSGPAFLLLPNIWFC